MITQEELKKLLHYDPETGVLTWVEGKRKNARAGWVMKNQDGKSYYQLWIRYKYYYSHRLAWLYMTGSLPEYEIDHIDGNGCNNKFLNLREVDRYENHKNRRIPSNNKSGLIGVCVSKKYMSWRSQIKVRNKQIHLGFFDNIFDASCARKSAEIKYGFHENHGSIRSL